MKLEISLVLVATSVAVLLYFRDSIKKAVLPGDSTSLTPMTDILYKQLDRREDPKYFDKT